MGPGEFLNINFFTALFTLVNTVTLFLVLNMCSVQALPTTMIAIRAQAGSSSPADIFLPTLGATGISMVAGVVLCQFFAARSKTHA